MLLAEAVVLHRKNDYVSPIGEAVVSELLSVCREMDTVAHRASSRGFTRLWNLVMDSYSEARSFEQALGWYVEDSRRNLSSYGMWKVETGQWE